VATDRPEANAHPIRRRIGGDRRRLPWRPLLVILGISAAVTTWYLFTVDAIKDEAGLLALQGRQEGPLTRIDPEKGIGFMAASLKNVSVLPSRSLASSLLTCRPIGEFVRCGWAC
jgi:hypothetical protein